MTRVAEEFVAMLFKLPEGRQDELAAMFLAELQDELQWDASFAASQNLLAKMAGDALTEYHNGQTEPLMENGEFKKN